MRLRTLASLPAVVWMTTLCSAEGSALRSKRSVWGLMGIEMLTGGSCAAAIVVCHSPVIVANTVG